MGGLDQQPSDPPDERRHVPDDPPRHGVGAQQPRVTPMVERVLERRRPVGEQAIGCTHHSVFYCIEHPGDGSARPQPARLIGTSAGTADLRCHRWVLWSVSWTRLMMQMVEMPVLLSPVMSLLVSWGRVLRLRRFRWSSWRLIWLLVRR